MSKSINMHMYRQVYIPPTKTHTHTHLFTNIHYLIIKLWIGAFIVCHFKSKIRLLDLSLIFTSVHQITKVEGAIMIADEVQKEPTNQLEIKTCWQNWFFYTIHFIQRIVLCCLLQLKVIIILLLPAFVSN